MTDAWDDGSEYEWFMGRWSRELCKAYVPWIGAASRQRWLDVGCGTGALAATILSDADPVELVAADPSQQFLTVAGQRLPTFVRTHLAGAEDLGLPSGHFDVVASALALNFVADSRAGLAEMARVTKPTGVVSAIVWDYADGMEMLRRFWDVVVDIDPAAADLDEGVRFPLCRPDALVDACSDSLRDVVCEGVEFTARFRDRDDLWRPFLGRQGPAGTYLQQCPPERRNEIRDRFLSGLPLTGEIALRARGWAVKGSPA